MEKISSGDRDFPGKKTAQKKFQKEIINEVEEVNLISLHAFAFIFATAIAGTCCPKVSL